MHDDHFMQLALVQAGLSALSGEVPVGAVLVHQGVVIANGHNICIQNNDPSAHAEMVVIRKAAQHFKNYRLEDCELYVTLEPCAMCSGAILHSRLKRVVYGATDPKTGTAGSVLNLFAHKQLNHQTEIVSGVMADECSHLLQSFFKAKRREHKTLTTPVREDALRTPDSHFNQLHDYPWPPQFVSELSELNGLRLHYLDVNPSISNGKVMLCLHGTKEWSYVFKNHIADWVEQGYRVIAPDYIGFGKSDKLKREQMHTLDFHVNYLIQLIQHLKLHHIDLAAQGVGALIAQKLLAKFPDRFDQGVSLFVLSDVEQSLTEAERIALYVAPFPDSGHKAGLRALANLQ